MIHIWLPEEMHKRLRIRVAEEDTDMQHWVAARIEQGLDKPQGKGAKS